ncbi:hypothetical protein I553_10572 [Mycobacterium xenopi 4042]|uniref:Uncharacterized protein n=1 Tax=Mycobacterium xenopi 4042 TaxID=1299334 RepID=X7ZDQ6_MYCXE|nr:hypothetical protein I553_10572 [Mycobacterium xenopi 4042]
MAAPATRSPRQHINPAALPHERIGNHHGGIGVGAHRAPATADSSRPRLHLACSDQFAINDSRPGTSHRSRRWPRR